MGPRAIAACITSYSLHSKRCASSCVKYSCLHAALQSPELFLEFFAAIALLLSVNKERGASCALVGSLGQSNSHHFGEQQYKSYLRSARTSSNSAMSSFYKSPVWCNARARKDEEINLEIAAMLYGVRQLVDGGMEDENDILFFHDVVVTYNKFLSCVIQVFVINEVSNRTKGEQKKFSDPKTDNVSRRNAKVALSLLELILSFVTLKESLGVERATLSGLMANGINNINDNGENDEVFESIDLQKSNNDARMNVVVNDLVMVVENQHQIMRHLRKQSGLSVFESVANLREETCPEEAELFLDGNYRALLRLVGDSIRPNDAMIALQDHIREDFDIEGFRQAMDQDQFWYAITLYMDRLHAMELLILEELENCEGCFDSFDLLSLKDEKLALSPETHSTPTELTQHSILPMRSKDEKRPELEEWEINLYEVEFHKKSKSVFYRWGTTFISCLGNLIIFFLTHSSWQGQCRHNILRKILQTRRRGESCRDFGDGIVRFYG